jgi:hypothetical protein
VVAGSNPGFFFSFLFFLFKNTGFTSSTFPIQPDFSQNQPVTITLNTGAPRALAQEAFGHKQSVKILEILNPTGYMLDFFRYLLLFI